jgi:hypothetical protein
MRKLSIYIAACIVLFGCQKESVSVTPSAETFVSKSMKKGLANCRLLRITTPANTVTADPPNEATFTYSNNGLLEKIKVDHNLRSDLGNDFLFIYDNKNRLMEYIEGIDGDGPYGMRHKYQHNKQGVIVSDSTFLWG